MAEELLGDDLACSGELSSFVTVGDMLSFDAIDGRIDSTVALEAERLPPIP